MVTPQDDPIQRLLLLGFEQDVYIDDILLSLEVSGGWKELRSDTNGATWHAAFLSDYGNCAEDSWWSGFTFPDPISAFVHAEISNWGQTDAQ